MIIQARDPETCLIYGVWGKMRKNKGWVLVSMRSQPHNAEEEAQKLCSDMHEETMVVKYKSIAEKRCRPS